MHELSIAMNILDIVASACEEGGHGKVEKVRVKVGRASGVMADSLHFSFECARVGTVAQEASLEIEEVPVGGHCRDCSSDFDVEGKFVLECPLCGGSSFSVDRGRELEIIDLEVED